MMVVYTTRLGSKPSRISLHEISFLVAKYKLGANERIHVRYPQPYRSEDAQWLVRIVCGVREVCMVDCSFGTSRSSRVISSGADNQCSDLHGRDLHLGSQVHTGSVSLLSRMQRLVRR